MSHDETPPLPHRRPTEELPALELFRYQLHRLNKQMDEASEQNREILAGIADLRGDMKVGSEKFAQHDAMIRELNAHKTKAVWGLITGLLGLVGALFNTLFHGGK